MTDLKAKHSEFIARFLLAAVWVIAAVTISTHETLWAGESIKVGIFQNKPIVYFEEGPKGLFVEVLDHVAEKEGWELDYVPCELKECFELLQSNKLDLMTSLGVSPGRSEFLTFSKEAIWTFWGTIYSYDHNVQGVFDLKDKKIGVRRKNKISFDLQKMLTKFQIPVQYVEFDNYEQAFKAFKEKTIEFIAVNNTYGFDKQNEIAVYKTPIVFSPFTAHFASPANGFHSDKLKVIDNYVKRLKADKSSILYTFQKKWFTPPEAFWTTQRIGAVSAVFLFLTICIMAWWRYRSIVKLNKELMHNISERKQVEKELLKWGHIFKAAQWGIALGSEDGKTFQLMNPAYAEMHGYQISELMQKEISAMFVPGFREKFPEVVKRCHHEGHFTFEADHIRKDGSIFPAFHDVTTVKNDGGQILYRIVSVLDITESQKAKQELQKEKDFVSTLIDGSPTFFVAIDCHGKTLMMNQSMLKALNYAKEEVIGTDYLATFVQQEDQESVAQLFAEIRTKHTSSISENYVVSKSGYKLLVEWHATPILQENGELDYFFGVGVDITERKEMEKNLRQAQKMEAIGTLAGGIAHDFNNILSGIFGYSELAKEDSTDPEEVRKDMEEVLKAAGRAKDLVKQILTFSHQSDQELMPLKIQLVIKEALKLLRSSIPTTIEFKSDIDSDCAAVLADPSQIHQIVMNLCTNAYHAMREKGGTLSVSLKQIDSGSKEMTTQISLQPGSYVKLDISDTGCGIPEENIDRIFEPYFTTKKIEEGTGLGLAVVHGIITSSYGDITVSSKPGIGTTFQIFLPTVENQATEVGMKQEPASLPSGNERVLLVDDDESLVLMHTKMLKRLGYKVTAFSSSLETLDTFKRNPEAFDLVITDMTMPKLTGADLAKQVLAIRPEMPIILCTGYNEYIDEDKAKALGIRDYLMKPLNKKELAKTIRNNLDSV